MVIAVDFDGTCVTHEYPKVGNNIGAGPVLRALTKQGHKIILWSMRNDRNGDLKDALEWFEKENIPLYGINSNPSQDWSNSPKAYADLYIDDAALGCPLIIDYSELKKLNTNRPFVDWTSILEYLDSKSIVVVFNDEFDNILFEIDNELQR